MQFIGLRVASSPLLATGNGDEFRNENAVCGGSGEFENSLVALFLSITRPFTVASFLGSIDFKTKPPTVSTLAGRCSAQPSRH